MPGKTKAHPLATSFCSYIDDTEGIQHGTHFIVGNLCTRCQSSRNVQARCSGSSCSQCDSCSYCEHGIWETVTSVTEEESKRVISYSSKLLDELLK